MPFTRDQATAIIETHQPELFRLAFSFTRDEQAAEAISAGCLLNALRGANRKAALDVWLAQCVLDACARRATWLELKAWLAAVIEGMREAAANDGPAEAGAAYSAHGLWPAYQKLSRAAQLVIALRYYHNYPIERIATLLRSDAPGVRHQLSQARDRLDEAVGGPHGMLGNYQPGLNHTQARQLLQSMVDQPLNGQPWMMLQTHLEGCPACRAYRQRLEILTRELGRSLSPYLTPPQPAGPQAAARLLATWEKRQHDARASQL